MREQPHKQWFRRLLRRARNEAVLCASFAAALLSALFVPPDAAYLAYIDLQRAVPAVRAHGGRAGRSRAAGCSGVLAQRLLGGERTLRALSLLLVLLPFFVSMLDHQRRGPHRARAVHALPAAPGGGGGAGRARLRAAGRGRQPRQHGHAHRQPAEPVPARALCPHRRPVLRRGAAAGRSSASPRSRSRRRCSSPRRAAGCTWRLRSPRASRTRRRLAAYAGAAPAVPRWPCSASSTMPWPPRAALLLLLLLRPAAAPAHRLRPAAHVLLLLRLFREPWAASRPCARCSSRCLRAARCCAPRRPASASATCRRRSCSPASRATGSGLLAGVNVGGLGTPVASLASLIALRLYLKEPGARAGRFLSVFALANAAGLLLLLPLAALLA